jgi:hypothetical protein
MKRTIFALSTVLVVFVAVFAVLVVRPVRKVKATPTPCSTLNGTLEGYYGWTEFGLEPESFRIPFWTQVGLAYFDGSGNFSESNIYYIENGVPDSGNPGSVTGGTYTVSSDCTMTITYSWGGETYYDNGVVVAGGSEVIADEYGPPRGRDMTTGHVEIKKVMGPT